METKTVIITGANSGLGFNCAKVIAASGQNWTIVLACRSLIKGQSAKQQLTIDTGHRDIHVIELNLSSIDSIHKFVSQFKKANLPPLKGLINNAGMQILQGLEYTKDGFEVTFGTNHLGHFLLTNLLLESLVMPARVIVVSSGTHDPATIDGRYNKPVFLGAHRLAYPTSTDEMSGLQRYATSKLCNLLFAYELQRKLVAAGPQAITVYAYDPGAVPATNLLNSIKNPWMRRMIRASTKLFRLFGVLISTPERSGAAMARLLLDPALAGQSGKYYQLDQEKQSSQQSYDLSLSHQLWEDSLVLVKLK